MAAASLERLFELVSELLPPILRELGPDDREARRWILFDDGSDADPELASRPSGEVPPIVEAFEVVSRAPSIAAIVVSRAFDPVDHVLGYGMAPRQRGSEIRRADVLRDDATSPFALDHWRWLG